MGNCLGCSKNEVDTVQTSVITGQVLDALIAWCESVTKPTPVPPDVLESAIIVWGPSGKQIIEVFASHTLGVQPRGMIRFVAETLHACKDVTQALNVAPYDSEGTVGIEITRTNGKTNLFTAHRDELGFFVHSRSWDHTVYLTISELVSRFL